MSDLNSAGSTQESLVAALALHSAYLYRANTKASNDAIKLFDALTKAMLSNLLPLLDDLSDSERQALIGGKYITKRLKEVKAEIDTWSQTVDATLNASLEAGAVALAAHEVSYIAEAMGLAVKKTQEVKIKKDVFKIAKAIPMTGGALVDEMMSEIAVNAQRTVWNTIRQGIQLATTNYEIIKNLRGNSEFNYVDSALKPTRRNIETTVRTIRSHVSNTAYLETYQALGVKELEFVATLDNRTSTLCASHDGERYKINEPHPTPPLHRSCRSVLAPALDSIIVGQRPAKGSDGVKEVSANTTYASWFKDQSAEFQKEWLGASRYQLYKDGGYTIDRFVDPIRGELTLAELKIRDQKTFAQVFK